MPSFTTFSRQAALWVALATVSASLGASCAKGETDPRDDKSPFGLGEGETDESGEGAGNQSGDCEEGQFQCGSGECIAEKYLCDVKAHCVDASDEFPNNAECVEPSCEATQFMCTSGECITGSYACDGYNDCADASDESTALCGSQPVCDATQWQCTSGECIPASYVCDTYYDCSDSSDELGC